MSEGGIGGGVFTGGGFRLFGFGGAPSGRRPILIDPQATFRAALAGDPEAQRLTLTQFGSPGASREAQLADLNRARAQFGFGPIGFDFQPTGEARDPTIAGFFGFRPLALGGGIPAPTPVDVPIVPGALPVPTPGPPPTGQPPPTQRPSLFEQLLITLRNLCYQGFLPDWLCQSVGVFRQPGGRFTVNVDVRGLQAGQFRGIGARGEAEARYWGGGTMERAGEAEVIDALHFDAQGRFLFGGQGCGQPFYMEQQAHCPHHDHHHEEHHPCRLYRHHSECSDASY